MEQEGADGSVLMNGGVGGRHEFFLVLSLSRGMALSSKTHFFMKYFVGCVGYFCIFLCAL